MLETSRTRIVHTSRGGASFPDDGGFSRDCSYNRDRDPPARGLLLPEPLPGKRAPAAGDLGSKEKLRQQKA